MWLNSFLHWEHLGYWSLTILIIRQLESTFLLVRSLLKPFIYLLVHSLCVCVVEQRYVTVMEHEWKSEDSLQDSVIYSHIVGLENPNQVIELSDKCLYLLSHLLGPNIKCSQWGSMVIDKLRHWSQEIQILRFMKSERKYQWVLLKAWFIFFWLEMYYVLWNLKRIFN